MDWYNNYKKKVFYRATVRWFNRVSLPGLGKVPIGAIVKYFTFTFQHNDISMRASAMAFNFFSSFVPSGNILFHYDSIYTYPRFAQRDYVVFKHHYSFYSI